MSRLFQCDTCKGSHAVVVWCGEEYGWACRDCLHHPWNGKLAWAAAKHRQEHEAERKQQRQARDDQRRQDMLR